MNIRAHVWVSGRVQGVFFRSFTREKAVKHGLTGWVRNLPDGTVEAVFEGEKSAVDLIVEELKAGPLHARVEKVEVVLEEPTGGFKRFNVRYF